MHASVTSSAFRGLSCKYALNADYLSFHCVPLGGELLTFTAGT